MTNNRRIVYCRRCGAKEGQRSECIGIYTTHDFTTGRGTIYCRRCGVVVGQRSGCIGIYTSHDFTAGSGTIYCRRCGKTVGKRSECIGIYTSHDFEEKPVVVPTKPSQQRKGTRKKIFIVHGRDKLPALELARIIENRYPIKITFLEEEAHGGDTLIEKLEKNSDVDFAFIILTPDDVGALKDEPLKKRGRQNVIFEWGVFLGKIKRRNICVLIKGNVEIPSDLQGIGYHRFKDKIKECFLEVDGELRKAGLIK